jgi:hypothetical protein
VPGDLPMGKPPVKIALVQNRLERLGSVDDRRDLWITGYVFTMFPMHTPEIGEQIGFFR